jgi:hypothetical protein
MTDINALIASAIPVQPPDEWFENPGLAQPHPIKVLPNGRVYGHVASWDMDHIGMPFGTRPPKSKSNYAYFKTGEIMTASGGLVPVGQLTLAGGHASLHADAAQAVKHYDDTNSAIADVSVGEDVHGIWVAGALRPNATPDQVRALRASAPSGDWRMINGRLEMVAVCQVNVPGFPIPRALAAGGQRLALVAAGSTPLLAQVLAEQEIEARLRRLEAVHEEQEAEHLAIVASAARDRVAEARRARLAREAELARQRVRNPEKFRQARALTAAAAKRAEEKAIIAAGQKLVSGDLAIESYEGVERAVRAFSTIAPVERIGARRTIIAAAVELGAFSALPEEWHERALVAAGNFDHLDADFLSRKAEEQPRDNNGRFVQTGAFLRWQTPGKEGYQFGQVIGRKVNPDGTIDIRLADSNTVLKRKPNQVEVIKAILPADQVDNENDRGVPYRKKEKKHGPDPMGSPGFTPDPKTTLDPAVVEAEPAGTPLPDDAPVPGETPEQNPVPKVGDRVASAADGTDLGTVTKSDDPSAIEVTDDGGLVTAHDSSELVVVPPAAAPAAPAAAPAA